MKMFNIFVVETLQNIPFVLGGVLGLYSWHNGNPWLGLASFILGNCCAICSAF